MPLHGLPAHRRRRPARGASPAGRGRGPLTGAVAAVERLEARFAERERRVGAYLEEPQRFARLRREAEVLEARAVSAPRGPLFAVMLGVKDIFHVAGLPTRAGSRVPPEELAGPEASSVARLRKAGALVVGKAVTTEFAYFAPGPTRNPVDASRTPGGSSSGSAAAVAAGLADVALGTQTIGSVLRPASYCGVVGFKPSWGRVPADGVIPLAPSVDHVGWFAPDVARVKRVASVLIGDREDPQPGGTPPTLGVPVGAYLQRAEEATLERLAAAVETLRSAGWSVVEDEVFADLEDIESRHRRLVAAEAARVHSRWYERWGDRYDRRTRELIATGNEVGDERLARDREGRETLRSAVESAMDATEIDAWLSPAAPGVAPLGLESTGDPVMNLPWTHAGLPAVSLPLPTRSGDLPLGLQIVGRFGDDERLLSWAADLAEVLGS